jgi:alpha-beta hydrolase superfamily lysophospholipase
MADTVVSIPSGDLKLKGILRIPDDVTPTERRAAVIVLHGFGSNTKSGNVQLPMTMLSDRGYITLGVDMRGCGDSEGEPGYIRCLDQVEDTSAAVTFLTTHPNVDRIALLGSSFGAAVAVYTGGVDNRVAAVISSGGWGDGERKFRGQHSGPGEWERFTAMLENGRRVLAETGKSPLVPRYDIVPIPPHLRGNLAEKSVHMFPAETAQSMFDFRADDVIGNIAPRPVLLLHSSSDSVTPTEQSIEMFKRAKQPCDLHLFAETDHFMFNDQSPRVRDVLFDWLDRYFPVKS